MQLDIEQKQEVERKLANALADGLYDNIISLSDLPKMTGYLLVGLEQITTQEQLNIFLKDISSKWEIFEDALSDEKIPIENSDEDRDRFIQNITNLAKDGKVDEAITLAKKAAGITS